MADLHVHTLTVRSHRIACDSPVLVQHGMGHDALALDLDAEWDGLAARLVLGPCGSAYDVLYEGEPVVVPAATLAEAGWLPVSVVGYGEDGTVRATTERCDHLLRVVESGCVDGSVPPEDQPDLLGQLVEAAGKATDAAKAAQDAVAKVDEAVSDLGDTAANAAAARESAEAAAKSASDAKASESSARASAESASADASSASSSKAAARQSATEASSSATGASQSATEAKASADSASQSASSASDDARTASQSASVAASAASSASEAAATAKSAVGTAQAAATSAREDASTARTAVETATTQAQAASASASAAAQSASAAAQSATSAKASADLAAGWVPDDGEPGQLLSKTDSGTAWVDPPSTGNVLVGEAEGYVAHAEDAYAQKPIEVRVKGKTWVNRWPKFSTTTTNGITLTCDETGLFTVSGTATNDAFFDTQVVGVAAGKKVTLIASAISGVGIRVEQHNADGNMGQSFRIVATTTGATGTLDAAMTELHAVISVANGTTVNTSFRVMLVDGTEAPDCFTPCASITSAQPEKLVTSGKNLLPPVSEWNVGNKEYSRYIDNPFPIGTQLVGRYGGNPSGLSGNVRLEFRENYDSEDYSAEITPWSATSTVGRAVTVTARDRCICIFTDESASAYFDQMQVQLELGSTVTSYEPPTITTTPLPEVELRSLPNGAADELVIKADGSCEVERDTYSYTATGEEDVEYGIGRALFNTGIPFTFVSGSSTHILCDKLPTIPNPASVTGCALGETSGSAVIYFNVAGETTDVDTTKAWLASNTPTFVFARNKTTEPQSPVTLPVLPAPTFNQYHDSDVPSDTSVTYARDINIVIDNLAKQIAGTAATVAINEATR